MRWHRDIEEIDCLPALLVPLGRDLYSAAYAFRVEGEVDGAADLVGDEVADGPGAVSWRALSGHREAAGFVPFEAQRIPPPGVTLQAPAHRDAPFRCPQGPIFRGIGDELVQDDRDWLGGLR